LLSGCAVATKALNPKCVVIGVEPAAADDATKSFKTGTLHTAHNPQTIADGARTPSLGKLTFPLIKRLVDDMVTVDDAAIVAAIERVLADPAFPRTPDIGGKATTVDLGRAIAAAL
jgi:threonine dehydratase